MPVRVDAGSHPKTAAATQPDELPENATGSTPRFDVRWPLFCLLVCALMVLAANQIRQRVRFPWDIYIWSESPFLTNMLKLSNGVPLYTTPADANSFVYSPGLEYLTYALLRPFGRQLDIRYCRAVSIGCALLAAWAFGRCALLLRGALFPEARSRLFVPVASAFLFLVIYHNYTSDVPHPDNLYMAHAGLTLLLVLEAIPAVLEPLVLAAVLVAGLGVLVKQVAAFSIVGACLALLLCNYRGLATSARLLLAGAVSAGGSLAVLWAHPWGKFYTFDVLSTHGIQFDKLPDLVKHVSFPEYRFLPLLLSVAALSWIAGRLTTPAAKLLAAVFLMFGFEACPALLAYLKPMGWWNNLAIIEVWMMLPVLPWVAACLSRRGQSITDHALSLLMALALVLSFYPQKLAPTPAQYDYCRTMQRLVNQDVKAGRRVLVPHVTTFLIRSDPRHVPLDRSNSYLELNVAKQGSAAGTLDRINARYYDKIYLNNGFYGWEMEAAIARNYREVSAIASPAHSGADIVNGYQWDMLLPSTRVMVRAD